MRERFGFGVLAAMLLSASLAAQGGQGQGSQGESQGVSQHAGSQQGTQGSERQQGNVASPKAGDDTVRVVGCLSAAEKNGIILTAQPGDLASGVSTRMSGAVRSVTYQLIGGDRAQLAGMIGRRVEVSGTTPDKAAAKLKTESETAHKSEGTSGKTAKVETEAKLHMEVRQLNVASVRQLSGDCAAGK